MPIYEYRCHGCNRRVSLFFRSFSATADPVCPNCQSTDLHRLMSKVNFLKSADQQLAKLDEYERYMNDLDDPNDPAAIERWAQRVGRDLDPDLGTDFREMAAQINGEDRPYDMYDPRGTLQMALERKRAELLGYGGGADAWMDDMGALSQGEPDFVREARDKGQLPDGSPFMD